MMTKLSFALLSAAFGVALVVGGVAAGPSRAHAQEAYVAEAAVSDDQAQIAQNLLSCLIESLPIESCISTSKPSEATETDESIGDAAQASSTLDENSSIDYGVAALKVEVSQSIMIAAPGLVAEDKDDPVDVASITIDTQDAAQPGETADGPPDTDATPLEVDPLAAESSAPTVEN
jgi:hypothetical protein